MLLKMQNIFSEQVRAVVYSESLDDRDFLRNRLSEHHLNTICFEKESICFDNFKSIKPNIVIAVTESKAVVWRFIFALHTMRLKSSLLILSDRLKAEHFDMDGMDAAVHFLSNFHSTARFLNKLYDMNPIDNLHQEKTRFPLFVGETQSIKEIRSTLPSIAAANDAVLVKGENGTGKELISRLIAHHYKDKCQFIRIDCGARHSEVLRNGWQFPLDIETDRFQATIFFLKNVHLLSSELQAKILYLMDRGRTEKVGTTHPLLGDVRFIATSNPEIGDIVENGKFRKDLYYRLNVIPVSIPPLRERKSDIALLMDFLLLDACERNKKCTIIPSQKSRRALMEYHWPGNVKELENCMNGIAVAGNESVLFDRKGQYQGQNNSTQFPVSAIFYDALPDANEIRELLLSVKHMSLKSICDQFVSRKERQFLRKALEITNWNRKKAASLLKISYKSLLNKIKDYELC